MNIEPRTDNNAAGEFLYVSVIENPFEPQNITRYQARVPAEGISIEKALEGKGEHVAVCLNGELIEQVNFATIVLHADDYLTICPVVQGGEEGRKEMFRLFAFITLAAISGGVAAGTIGGLSGGAAVGASIALNIVGGILINALLPIGPAQNQQAAPFDAPSYGLDGAKNTATQATVVPVVYGTARIVPNRVGIHTKLVPGTNTQDLYLLYALSEGEIDGYDGDKVLVDGQAISTFPEGEVVVGAERVGTNTQSSPEFFDEGGLTAINKSKPIIYELYESHLTTSEVEGFRLDFVAPSGLRFVTEYNQDIDYDEKVVVLAVDYRLQGSANWTPLMLEEQICGAGKYNFGGPPVGAQCIHHPVNGWEIVRRPGFSSNPWYSWRDTDGDKPEWYGDITDNEQHARFFDPVTGVARNRFAQDDWNENDTLNTKRVRPGDLCYWVQDPSIDSYTAPGQNAVFLGVAMDGMADIGPTARKTTVLPFLAGNTTSAVRGSFEKMGLPSGVYEVRVSRPWPNRSGTGPAYKMHQNLNDVTWTDINELVTGTFIYPNTAMLSMKLRMTERLNHVPEISAEVRGRLVKVRTKQVVDGQESYVWSTELSSNPAWVAYDMLTDTRIGAGVDEGDIDIEKWQQWADFCTENELEFNALFQTPVNTHDALQYPLRAGHAQLVRTGTRYSVAIERPDEPVMMFNVGNIIKGSLKINWLPKEERVNEVEVTFYDRDNLHDRTVVVVRDPNADDDPRQRVHRLDGYWITKRDQAVAEATFELNANRLINHIVSFEAPMEALACTVGDQILLQHDVPTWNDGGRTATGSTTTLIKLDRPVTMVTGESYKLLLQYDTIQRFAGTVPNQPGSLSGATSFSSARLYLSGYDGSRVRRLVHEGVEHEVIESISYGGMNGVRLASAVAFDVGDAIQLWDTDAIEERAVTNVNATVTEVTATSAFPSAPAALTKWMFGKSALVRRPYRVKAITGASRDTRTITAVEYNEDVYNLDGVVIEAIPAPAAPISHVQNLEGEAIPSRVDTVYIPEIQVTWQPPVDGVYGGADVFASTDGLQYSKMAEVKNGVLSCRFLAPQTRSTPDAGDPEQVSPSVFVKVLAFDIFGKRCANAALTPIVAVEAGRDQYAPDAPTDVAATSAINGVSLSWTKPIASDFKAVRLYRGTTTTFASATLIAEIDSETALDPVAPGTTYYYFLTSVDFVGNESDPHEALGTPGAARQVEGSDIEAGTIDYNTHVVNAPPSFAALDTPVDGELFPLRSHLTGTRTTYPSSFVASKRFRESPFGTDCYAVEGATTNLMGTQPAALGGLDLTDWQTGASVTVASAASGWFLVTNAGGTYQGVNGSVLEAALADGSVHTGSLYVQNHNLTPVTIKWQAMGSAEQTRTLAPLEEIRIAHTNTATWDSTNNFVQVLVEPGKAVRMVQPQVEQKNYASSYTASTRAEGKIVYNSYLANKDAEQLMVLGWNQFQVAQTEQVIYSDYPSFWLERNGTQLVLKWTAAAGLQTWNTGLNLPTTDFDPHLIGFEFDAANNVKRVFLDDDYAEQAGAFDITATPGEFRLGGLNLAPVSSYTAQSLLSNVQVVYGATHITPAQVAQVYALRKPFSDTAARVDTPEPASVTLEFV